MRKAVLIIMALGLTFTYAQKKEPTFEREGKMVKATYFHDNGLIAQTGYMLKGKLHGDWTMFDAKGEKIAEGRYENGMKQGTWFFWEGELVKEVSFVDSKIAAVKDWNASEGVTVN